MNGPAIATQIGIDCTSTVLAATLVYDNDEIHVTKCRPSAAPDAARSQRWWRDNAASAFAMPGEGERHQHRAGERAPIERDRQATRRPGRRRHGSAPPRSTRPSRRSRATRCAVAACARLWCAGDANHRVRCRSDGNGRCDARRPAGARRGAVGLLARLLGLPAPGGRSASSPPARASARGRPALRAGRARGRRGRRAVPGAGRELPRGPIPRAADPCARPGRARGDQRRQGPRAGDRQAHDRGLRRGARRASRS